MLPALSRKTSHEGRDVPSCCPNVSRAEPGSDLRAMLLSGDSDAAIGVAPVPPAVVPLIADPEAVAHGHFRRSGILPINRVVVIRTDVARAGPWLPWHLLELFTEAKETHYASLRRGAAEDSSLERLMAVAGDDPFPYGIEPNRKALETLLRNNLEHHVERAQIL